MGADLLMVDRLKQDLAQFAAVLSQGFGVQPIPLACDLEHQGCRGLYGPDWELYAGTSIASPAAYAASKGELLQLTRWLATTLGPEVRGNSISPGGIARSQSISFVERHEARTPLKRIAAEDDFRGALAYPASDMSAYVTGQNRSVDGGWGSW